MSKGNPDPVRSQKFRDAQKPQIGSGTGPPICVRFEKATDAVLRDPELVPDKNAFIRAVVDAALRSNGLIA